MSFIEQPMGLQDVSVFFDLNFNLKLKLVLNLICNTYHFVFLGCLWIQIRRKLHRVLANVYPNGYVQSYLSFDNPLWIILCRGQTFCGQEQVTLWIQTNQSWQKCTYLCYETYDCRHITTTYFDGSLWVRFPTIYSTFSFLNSPYKTAYLCIYHF